MGTLLWVVAFLLVGVWVAETVLFLLSYRSNARAEGVRTVKRLT